MFPNGRTRCAERYARKRNKKDSSDVSTSNYSAFLRFFLTPEGPHGMATESDVNSLDLEIKQTMDHESSKPFTCLRPDSRVLAEEKEGEREGERERERGRDVPEARAEEAASGRDSRRTWVVERSTEKRTHLDGVG